MFWSRFELRTQKIQVRALSLGPNWPVVFNNNNYYYYNYNNGVQHTTGVRRALARSDYTQPHNQAATIVHQELTINRG